MHAGWNISGAKERYLKYENAGDKFVSRLVCGLKPSSPEFAISPPYFETKKKTEEKEVSYFLIDIFGYEFISDSILRMLVRIMRAIIAFRYSWIKSNMPASNHFFPSAVFDHLSSSLIKISKAKNLWNKTDNKTNSTGIPPYVTILNMLEAIRTSQDGVCVC